MLDAGVSCSACGREITEFHSKIAALEEEVSRLRALLWTNEEGFAAQDVDDTQGSEIKPTLLVSQRDVDHSDDTLASDYHGSTHGSLKGSEVEQSSQILPPVQQFDKSFDVFRRCYSENATRGGGETLVDSFYDRLKEVLDTVPAAVTWSDMDNNVLFALENKYWYELTQCTLDDVLGMRWLKYVSVPCGASAPIGDGSDVGLWTRKDGTSVTMGSTTYYHTDPATGIKYQLKITVNRHFENELFFKNQELAQALQLAESASRAKDRLVASVSHELRTPLNGMMGTARLLQESENLDAEQRELVDAMSESGEALKSVIDDLLVYSSMELGKAKLNPEPFSLRSVCRSVVVNFRASTLKKASVSLSLQIEDNVPDALMGDAVRLRQVMFNLVGNALKFTDAGSVAVTVRLAESRDVGTEERPAEAQVPKEPDQSAVEPVGLFFEVKDTGRGIPPELQDQLFKPFSRVEQVQRYSGTGLGLSISKQIVEMMSGRLWMESDGSGAGSAFKFTSTFGKLATVDDVNLKSPTSPRLSNSKSIRGTRRPPFILSPTSPLFGLNPPLRVLLAEDNPVSRMVATKFLGKLGVRADDAHDGQEAVDMCQRGNVDGKGYEVVLMDGQMPKLTGLEAAHAIRALLAPLEQPYIIALTANVTEGDIAQARSAGIREHLGKPVSLEDLTKALERAVVEKRRGEPPC
ncbi:hypothetical protein M427DRAFT_57155 [Gonapodya prolifera JEL478]|uniref:Histidine kinase n=1 Tax=Gonapodya prolifera (strain JEL478) TaxID=1344416 RepID=A0A139AE29_GONPJ|nr:hypothetical protein M427DRAFT_57155 [Gonapodya prolifera JEL478]|eukprot:KXS15018.1 hypothetical protein M427DRAFT_57155 [Gonapodya prolifera JEL478]